ncbi:hypothetical protein P3W43_02770 [Salinicola salarius]|uniref:hypothetical protein n=1 Tax=Salinicola salarius TaxID=430457 RepID=UPI0023E3E8A7|nr:hypothetical protein [Salinicola salarius]MDF3917776.1 hypothetical protein [Salinicola salarius]
MFWRPDHIEPSAWLDHLPLLFWLMEAMAPQRCVTLGARRGSPHTAFCQGTGRLGLDAECLLVADDEDDLGAEIHAMADRRYGAIARRLNAAPRRAAKQIEPGSVDVLALDVSASDADMEDILDRWLSRVSERGIVLIPGINRREPGCVAHEHFAALQSTYRSLTFHHGDGLGILVVGERPAELIETLLSRWNAPTAARTVREVFARLGRGCADQALAEAQTARLRDSSNRLDQVSKEREAKEAEVSELQARLRDREAYLDELESDKLHLAEEISDARSQVQALEAELRHANIQLAERDASIQTRFEEIATLTRMAEERDAAYQQLQQAQSNERQQWESERSALMGELAELRQLPPNVEPAQTESRCRELEAALKERDENIATRFKELAILTRMLEEKDAEIAALKGEPGDIEPEEAYTTPAVSSSPESLSDEASPRSGVRAATAASRWALGRFSFGTERDKRKERRRLRRKREEALAELEASEWFDAQWYLQQYPDIASDTRYSTNPALHYLKFGGFEGRNPSPHFDSEGYLEAYPDVAMTEINPLLHFIRDGIKEGRSPRP